MVVRAIISLYINLIVIINFADPSIPEYSTQSYTHMSMERERIGIIITWKVC